MSLRILFFSQDQTFGTQLHQRLTREGYGVCLCKDQSTVFNQIFDCLILDLELPYKSVAQVLTSLRYQNSKIPILLLTQTTPTATAQFTPFKKLNLNYQSKHNSIDELVQQLKELHTQNMTQKYPIIQYGDFVFEPHINSLYHKEQLYILSGRESALLTCLFKHRGKPVLREQLRQAVYGSTEVTSNTIETFIHSLRKKLKILPIHTIHGQGYMIDKEPINESMANLHV